MFADVLGFAGIPVVGGLSIVAGIAAFLYLPLIGRQIAVVLFALAIVVFAYGAGFNERGKLDHSADIAAQLAAERSRAAELEREAIATRKVADDARAAQFDAERVAADNQAKVEQYAEELAKRPQCNLEHSDVERLRGLGARTSRAAKPSAPAGNRPGSHSDAKRGG